MNNMMIPDRGAAHRQIGFGRSYRNFTGTGQPGVNQDARSRFIGDVTAAMAAPTYQLPTIESVRWHADGPLSDSQVQATFGATIDPLGSNSSSPPPGITSVESTMASPGELQTWTLILAIGWHVEPEPLNFDLQGNALSPVPTVGTKMPVSPDAFSNADTIIATGTLGLVTGQTLIPALMQYGWWPEKAFYHMARGYNLVWQWGNNASIIRDSLRFTAYTPSNGQEGSSSNALVDSSFFVRSMNQFYVNPLTLNSNAIFLPIDRSRIGNMTLEGTAGLSVYRPNRAYEQVQANFGGMGLRSFLRGNTEWRRLTTPFLMKPGVPIGLKAQLSNQNDALAMQNWLSAQFGFGVTPADFTSYSQISTGVGVTGTAVVGAEPSLDNPVAPQGITTITDRVVFKGGGFKLTVALKGFELTDDQAAWLQQNGGGMQSMMSQCGCQSAT